MRLSVNLADILSHLDSFRAYLKSSWQWMALEYKRIFIGAISRWRLSAVVLGCLFCLVLFFGFYLPLYFSCDALKTDIDTLESKLELMKAPIETKVQMSMLSFRKTIPAILLQAARESGVSLEQFETPSKNTASPGFHLIGEASLSQWVHWLRVLTLSRKGIYFSTLNLQVESDGRLRFSATIKGGGERMLVSLPAFPEENPFCHAVSLVEAKKQAAESPVSHYPLALIQYIGSGVTREVHFAIVRLPGEAAFSVRVGEKVGLEKAKVDQINQDQLRLQLASGAFILKKRMY